MVVVQKNVDAAASVWVLSGDGSGSIVGVAAAAGGGRGGRVPPHRRLACL